MSDRIKLLPEVVANQIAAGEVVNRPASVIKEMMENSIDADSSCIIVNFRDGGGDLIQIVDNGCGMSPNDARMAFDRHATSKIEAADDIYKLRTFGFRGEALASIAAVSQVELRTRQVADDVGTTTLVNGGEFDSQAPVMCEVGSQFFVRNLFYNVPARRKFMDKPTTSANQIKAEFKRVALCNPDIHFELYSNDSPLYNLPPRSLAGRIVDVVGRSIKHNLLEVHADTSMVKLRGYIGKPAAAKKSNSDQYLFVNGRFFKSSFFTKAILKGYEKLISPTLTPSYFLYLTVDPEKIDVNVHPQKTEVKFADNDAIWQIIVAAVRETLAKTGAVPMMDFDDTTALDIPIANTNDPLIVPRSSSGAAYNPFDEGYINPKAPNPNVDFVGFDVPYNGVDAPKPTAPRRQSELKEQAYSSMMSSFALDAEPEYEDFESAALPVVPTPMEFEESIEIESAANVDEFESSTFEFVESAIEPEQLKIEHPAEPVSVDNVVPMGDGFAFMKVNGEPTILDVERGQFRVLFDQYMKTLSGGSSVSQQLLFPERLTLSNHEYELIEENSVDFAIMGFEIDLLGGGSIDVRGIPSDCKTEDIDTTIYELLSVMLTPNDLAEVRREKLAAVMAGNGSRSWRRVQQVEPITQMAIQLFESGNIGLTPSGKAICWKVTAADIRAKIG